MNMINDLKIRNRLMAGFGVLILMMVAATVIGVASINSINRAINSVLFQIQYVEHTQEVSENVQNVYQHMAILMLETDPAERPAILADLQGHRSAYLEALDWFHKNTDTEEEVALLKVLDDELAKARETNNRILELIDIGNINEARQIYLKDGLDHIPPWSRLLMPWSNPLMQKRGSSRRTRRI